MFKKEKRRQLEASSTSTSRMSPFHTGDEEYRNISSHLYGVLDWVGASDEFRAISRDSATISDVLMTLHNNPGTHHTFGSSSEGTTTPGLNSDIDWVTCFDFHVTENITVGQTHEADALIVTDNTTKPGYCKLQSVSNKMNQPIPWIELSLMAVGGSRYFIKHVMNTKMGYQRNGPAWTLEGNNWDPDKDVVYAFKCHHIPSFANSWIPRIASVNQLNKRQITMLEECGCFFVGVNHPHSQNGPIEWRLSFSLQERELMYSLNPTQNKCYVLLKMIKKDIVHKRVPASISSYHCKTCLLYTVEKTSSDIWTPENLLECTRLCIDLLLQWVKERLCPNYFIPEENMFDRLEQSTLTRVQTVLEDMIEHWYNFVWSLTCDDVGGVLKNVLYGAGPDVLTVRNYNVLERNVTTFISDYKMFCFGKLLSLYACRDASLLRTLYNLMCYQNHLKRSFSIYGVTKGEIEMTINYLLPHLQLLVAQCLTSILLTSTESNFVWVVYAMFKYYLRESKDCDAISSYLIEASYYLQSGQYGLCEKILFECEAGLNVNVQSVCRCCNRATVSRDCGIDAIMEVLRSHDIPYKEFSRTYTSGCVTVIPEMANLVPRALQYEMYRSYNITSEPLQNENNDFWFDWAAVDSKVYLYFLQYILYSTINKPYPKREAIGKLEHVILNDSNLGHRDTARNLLGWICNKENNRDMALSCYMTSWQERPYHNAVKWHLLMMYHSLVHTLSGIDKDA